MFTNDTCFYKDWINVMNIEKHEDMHTPTADPAGYERKLHDAQFTSSTEHK